MRISAPITVSALVVAGLVATGSAAHTSPAGAPAKAPEALLAAASGPGKTEAGAATELSRTVGLLPVSAEPPRKLTAMTPPADGPAPFAGTVPLQNISLPMVGGALGIPEVVLAAYRNAELAMESSMPGCGLSWSLLAGIGRIESGHAGGGRTDVAGTTVTPIFGPALDGTLPGNEIIKTADGGYVRAIGPMQFLPGTWSLYAADGNGDGVADPNNVFDAALAAGKYLCSGGLDLRDPAQELRSVLRYNNSMSYAANVLSWSAAYRTGGSPTQVTISPDLIPPGSAPANLPDMTVVSTTVTPTPAEQSPTVAPPAPSPTQVMITIPGLPPIPCGIFCPPPPPPANPCDVQPAQVPAPVPGQPGLPGQPGQPLTPGQVFGAETGEANDPAHPQPLPRPASCNQPQAQPPGAANAPQSPGDAVQANATPAPEVAKTPEAAPEPAPAPAPEQAPPPPAGITLAPGIVIPLP
ncbi:lytic murein transglycosylase [Nocardia sp. NPDC052566]|uniref:lytic transglycosylase domain-containing protein n=1 Tax=Nocardia sp. NPDC052566 TaxID=3364330 RepID=UPI0037C9F734